MLRTTAGGIVCVGTLDGILGTLDGFLGTLELGYVNECAQRDSNP